MNKSLKLVLIIVGLIILIDLAVAEAIEVANNEPVNLRSTLSDLAWPWTMGKSIIEQKQSD
jgi:hypothetical protein